MRRIGGRAARSDDLRAAHTCYLIQKSSTAPSPDVRACICERCCSPPTSRRCRPVRSVRKAARCGRSSNGCDRLCEQIVPAMPITSTRRGCTRPGTKCRSRAAPGWRSKPLRDVGDARIDRDRPGARAAAIPATTSSASSVSGSRKRCVTGADRRPRQRNLFIGSARERVERAREESIMPYQKIPSLGIEYALDPFRRAGPRTHRRSGRRRRLQPDS